MIQICPNCRSTFNLIDKVDVSAAGLQSIHCPVCKQEIWVSSGYLLPKRWEVGEVIKRHPPEGSPPEAQVFEQTIPKSAEKPVWNIQMPDFSAVGKGISKITNPVGEFFGQSFKSNTGTNFLGGFGTGAVVVIVIIVVILIFAMRK